VLTRLNDWDKNGSYRVFGKAYPEQDVLVFNFSDAEIINENDMEDELGNE